MSEKEKPSEKKFEEYIESYLLKNNYKTSKNEDYNKDLCIIKKNLLAFVKDTQETKWKSLKNILRISDGPPAIKKTTRPPRLQQNKNHCSPDQMVSRAAAGGAPPAGSGAQTGGSPTCTSPPQSPPAAFCRAV